MQLPGEFTGALEIALSRWLAVDEVAAERAARLNGRCLAIRLREPDVELVFRPGDTGMRVEQGPVDEPDVRLTGGVGDFARNLFGDGQTLGGGIRVEGDVGLAQSFARLLQDADIDFEDWLARHLGDVPAELAGRALRAGRGLARRAADILPRDLAEYLREETGDLVGRAEADEWLAEVDRLRADADRLAQRVKRLSTG